VLRTEERVSNRLCEEANMLRLTTMKAMRKVLRQGAFVAFLTAPFGSLATGVTAQEQELWTIMIHFQYQDGFEFDYVLERGVSTTEVGAALAACGRSHRTGSVVRYQCYPVPE
jgi:hypothetical protein